MKTKTIKAKAVGPDRNGQIPIGSTCKYSPQCFIKDIACSGKGCPVSNGRTTSVPFSCGLARGFQIGCG